MGSLGTSPEDGWPALGFMMKAMIRLEGFE
jgi:hypothetical protein